MPGPSRSPGRQGQCAGGLPVQWYSGPHSEGPHTWDLMLCDHCLEILTDCTFEFGFSYVKSSGAMEHAEGTWSLCLLLPPASCLLPKTSSQ